MLYIQMQLRSWGKSQASIQNYSLQLKKGHWFCLDLDTEIKFCHLCQNQVEFRQKIITLPLYELPETIHRI